MWQSCPAPSSALLLIETCMLQVSHESLEVLIVQLDAEGIRGQQWAKQLDWDCPIRQWQFHSKNCCLWPIRIPTTARFITCKQTR